MRVVPERIMPMMKMGVSSAIDVPLAPARNAELKHSLIEVAIRCSLAMSNESVVRLSRLPSLK